MSARGTSFSFVYMKEALLLGVVVQTSAAWTRLPALKDYKSLRPLEEEGGGLSIGFTGSFTGASSE